MTITERNIKLKHFINCLKCEIHGRECDDNCPTQYEAGNMGEIIENLEEISKALDQQPEPCEDAVSRKAVYDAMVEKGQRSRRYKLGESWELNGTEIREVLDTMPSAQPENIRCKECLWRVGRDCTRFTDLPVCMDDYCGRAKRRG